METKECRICNLCENPAKFEDATEVKKVNCHVKSHSNDIFTVWRCNNCKSLHSLESIDLEYYYSDYPFKRHTLDYHTRIGYKNRINLLKNLGLQKDHTIIDVGCGKGLFVDALKKEGYQKATGYDFFIEEYSDVSVLKKAFDIVVSYDVIEHIEEPRQFLDMLIGMVKPGGMLMIGTPNSHEIDLYEEPSVPELSQPFHRHIFSKDLLIQMVLKNSFKIVDINTRSYFDTLIPFVNLKFMWTCLNASGGMLDSAVEPPPWGKILTSPKLIFLGLFGYFFRTPGNMAITFRKLYI